MENLGNILVTGGAGFMGSDFIRLLLEEIDYPGLVVNYDLLTYAANLDALKSVENHPRYLFERGDILDRESVLRLLQKYHIKTIVHFAAESHVDRSINEPGVFVGTNVLGTEVLLEAALSIGNIYIHHISTDEVYGQLRKKGAFTESSPYRPRSPYSASKAASDHLVAAAGITYGLEYSISHSSNNFGPWQNPEKLIPKTIYALLHEEPVPLYGTGQNIREWLFVRDHSRGIWSILNAKRKNTVWNLGGGIEMTNLQVVETIIRVALKYTDHSYEELKKRVIFVPD